MNILPNEVIHSVRNCDMAKQHVNVNSLLGYRGTQADLNARNFLSSLKPPPTEGFKDYNTKQIETCEALVQKDSATSSSPPLFPPPAPSPPPIPFNFSHSVVTDPVPNPIPSSDPSISIPTPQ